MTVSISLRQLTFSGGESIELEPESIVVIVGPNNAGKSQALREIIENVSLTEPSKRVVTKVEVQHTGSIKDFHQHLSPHRFYSASHQQDMYNLESLNDSGHPEVNVDATGNYGLDSYYPSMIDDLFWGERYSFNSLNAIFFYLADFSTRLDFIKPAPAFDLLNDIPRHPIQKLCLDKDLMDRISRYFQQAFGQSLTLNRTAGGKIPIHCGERPALAPDEDSLSIGYARRLAQIPLLHEQGDGMRHFAGCLLQTLVGGKFVVLLDEPEAFLHPPQARFLGSLLVRERPAGRQFIISTHSGDLLRGILDANPKALKVLRLTRQGDLNHAHELDTGQLSQLWQDPILRYSNTLDSLFHEQTILCEADGDCRFYAAVLDALHAREPHRRRPDVMFTSTGGKHKLPTVAEALTRIGVPTRVVTDFDVLNNDTPLKGLFEALKGSWPEVQADWKRVKAGVERRRPELETPHVRRELERILGTITTDTFPAEAVKHIQATLKRTSPWEEAKRVGLGAVPAGQERQVAERLLERFRQQDLFIVKSGELESFYPQEGGHGNEWVAAVLEKNLLEDPHLEEARRFVRALIPPGA